MRYDGSDDKSTKSNEYFASKFYNMIYHTSRLIILESCHVERVYFLPLVSGLSSSSSIPSLNPDFKALKDLPILFASSGSLLLPKKSNNTTIIKIISGV